MSSGRVRSMQGIQTVDDSGRFNLDPAQLREYAAQHEDNRLGLISRTLLVLNMLRVRKFVGTLKDGTLHEVTVSLAGAHWQAEEGDEGDGTEAAHCLPRQVLINGRRPEDHLPVDHEARILFEAAQGAVDPLLFPCNKADSKAERGQFGIAAAFERACRQVLAKSAATSDGRFKRMAILAAFAQYRSEAIARYQQCMADVKEKLNAAPWRPMQLQALESYLKVIQSYPVQQKLSDTRMECATLGFD